MDSLVKTAFVAALKSGEYKQGKLFYKKIVDGVCYHCAMGVLADVIGLYKLYPTSLLFEAIQIPYTNFNEAMNNIGVSQDDRHKLVMWNDRDNLTFPEIADLVEQKM